MGSCQKNDERGIGWGEKEPQLFVIRVVMFCRHRASSGDHMGEEKEFKAQGSEPWSKGGVKRRGKGKIINY